MRNSLQTVSMDWFFWVREIERGGGH